MPSSPAAVMSEISEQDDHEVRAEKVKNDPPQD